MIKKISVFIIILSLLLISLTSKSYAYEFEQTDNVFYSYSKIISGSQTSGNLTPFNDVEYFALPTFVHVQRFLEQPTNNVAGRTVVLPANSTYQIKGELGSPIPNVDYIITFIRTDIVDSSHNFNIMIPDIGYNSLIFRQFISSEYTTGYDEGLKDGYNNAFKNAFDEGYENAKIEFGYDDNGIIIPGQSAYNKGYSKATQESGELKADIINFVPGVLGSIFMFFFQLGQIGILGITILDILGILVLISGLIFLIKFFF